MAAAGPPLLAGLVALALGVLAVEPGVAFWDTAEFQIVGPVLGTAHPTGFPAYVILGWLASILLQPLGEPAFRMNLLSAVLLAGAAAGLAVLVARLTGRRWLGLGAAAALATTPLVWSLATHADPHAMHLLVVGILLTLLVAWEDRVIRARREGGTVTAVAGRLDRERAAGDGVLLAASVVFGVGLATHTLIALLAPGIGLFVIAVEPGIVRRRRLILRCLAAIAIPAGVLYLELPIRAFMGAPLVYDHPDTPTGFFSVALGTQFAGTLTGPLSGLSGKSEALVTLAGDQLGWLAPLVPVGFLATVWRRPRYALLTLPGVVLTCWFAATYTNAEITRYYAGPALIAISWLAILAATVADVLSGVLERASPSARRARYGPNRSLLSGLAGLVALAMLAGPAIAAAPGRYAAVDERSDTAAAQWLDAAFAILPQRAVVVSWWDYSTTLWYGQLIEHRRPDLWIVDDRTRLDQHLGDVSDVIASQLGKRPVFVIRLPADLPAVAARFRLEPVVVLAGQEPIQHVLGAVNGAPGL